MNLFCFSICYGFNTSGVLFKIFYILKRKEKNLFTFYSLLRSRDMEKYGSFYERKLQEAKIVA